MAEPTTLAERAMRVAFYGAVPEDDQHVIADMMMRIERLEVALATIRDTLPLINDEYARMVFKTAANALEPETTD